MACPHVAGLLALGLGLDPSKTNAEALGCLYDTASDIDGDNTISFMEFQKQMNTIRPKRRDPRALSATYGGGKPPGGSSTSVKTGSTTSVPGRR